MPCPLGLLSQIVGIQLIGDENLHTWMAGIAFGDDIRCECADGGDGYIIGFLPDRQTLDEIFKRGKRKRRRDTSGVNWDMAGRGRKWVSRGP